MWQGLIVDHINGPFGSYYLLYSVDVDKATPAHAFAMVQVDQYTCQDEKGKDEEDCSIEYFNIMPKRKDLPNLCPRETRF